MTMIFQCPVCQLPLVAESKRYFCENGHSFDCAKEGYVNLLLANQKKSKQPGDSPAMMRSRAAFLSAGYYQSLAEAITKIIDRDKTQTLLDIGCGEGYYVDFLREQSRGLDCYGIDISKDAVRLAAKQYPELNLAVASVYQLPIQDDSVDILLNVFSPRHLPEMARVAKNDAHLLVVTPMSNHLQELREIIYDEVQPYKLLATDAFEPEFSIVDGKTIQFEIDLKSTDDIANLLQMTPFYWHISAEKQAELMQLERLSVSVSFGLSMWRKQA